MNWEVFEAIGTWLAGAGTIAAVVVALHLANRNYARERELNLNKKWNRIYHHLRDMSVHLEVAAGHDQRIKDATDRHTKIAVHGLVPSEYELQLVGKWMQLSSESFKVALASESEIIDLLCGEKQIAFENKEKIIKTIDMTAPHTETFEQTYARAKKIETLNQELVLPNADPELAKILHKK